MTRYNKALIAAAVAVLITVLQTVMSQQADGQWTTEDTLVTLLAFLGAVGVWAKANTPPAGQPSDPNVSETDPQRGDANVLLILAVVGVVLLVLLIVGVI